MKVLFVGEGRNDVGNSHNDPVPCLATGVIPTLIQRVHPIISEAIAHRWTHIPRIPLNIKKLDREMKRRGYKAKVFGAVLLGALRYGCDGRICVVDGDTADDDCLEQMKEGKDEALNAIGRKHVVACGVVYQSIEAWTLGAPDAIADELGIEPASIRRLMPSKHIEDLKETSGVVKQRPSVILREIVALGHKVDCTELRVAIAARTDLAALEAACPRGFKPFADELRQCLKS